MGFREGDIVVLKRYDRRSLADIPHENRAQMKVTKVTSEIGGVFLDIVETKEPSNSIEEYDSQKRYAHQPANIFEPFVPSKKKVNDLSDMDADFSLSVLKNVLLNKCLELAETFEEDGVESVDFSSKLAQIKSLGTSIEKLEA